MPQPHGATSSPVVGFDVRLPRRNDDSYYRTLRDSERDRVLTEARTTVVRNYLVENFQLDDTRMRTLGMGKTEQLGENGKVQIIVYSRNSLR